MTRVFSGILIVLCMLSFSSFISVNKNLLNSFKNAFPLATEVQWSEEAEGYQVYFLNANVRNVVLFDMEGDIVEATRYFLGANLPLNILWKIKMKYKTEKIYCVTEVYKNHETAYYVKLESVDFWTEIKANEEGNFVLIGKIRKQL